jgi:NitT/TauT family transport system substrate-binding protein
MKIREGLSTLLFALCAVSPLAAHAQAKPANVRVVLAPITNYTPLIVGRDKGWFAEEGLNVTWSIVPGSGGVAVEAVYGGSAEIGGSSVLEPMVARGNGLDIMFAVPGTKIQSKPPDNSALVVRDKDNIRRAADLTGKTVSAGLQNSVNHIHMLEWFQRNKVDPKGVKYIEIPFPQMADALFQNRLDAVWAVEPFLTIMLKSGNARILAHPYLENIPGMDITAYVAKESWLKANADTARRFKRVIDRATEELLKMPKPERDGWVAKFTGVKPELVAEMALPTFTRQFNVPSLQANLDLAVRHKVVKPFKVETMIWNP